jgi:hexosaminidase
MVQTSNATLYEGTNYNYSLTYLKGGVKVSMVAATPFGVSYAMETLLQLASSAAQPECGGGFDVNDAPTFEHRGLLIDSSRRFFPTTLVETTIEAMAIFKLNVLHFHLSDAQGFRVESKLYPQLNQPKACSDCTFYTQDEVRSIVDFAYLRGVRVVPEFDMPGHASAICTALKPDGIACCSGKWGMGQIGDDADGNSTRLVGALLAEMYSDRF